MINIVLVEPEIPQNTGNISRTCAVIGASLHLVEPMGFKITDRYLKRAGLDYWDKLIIKKYSCLDEFFSCNKGADCYYFSTKAKRNYTDVVYTKDTFLLFGKETKGLPEPLIFSNMGKTVRIPMKDNLRSLNLSNAVAIAAYEVLRQHNFTDLH